MSFALGPTAVPPSCGDGSDEAYIVCPTESMVTVTETPGDCRSYEFRCNNRECISDFARSAACDGTPQCSDGSDETGCPTSSPSLASAAPTSSPPTASPVPAPTPAPTPTPQCLSRCGGSLTLLNRVASSPAYPDSWDCRACLGGFADMAAFCASSPDPQSYDCAYSNTEPLLVHFWVPSGSTASAMASIIQSSFEHLPGVNSGSWSDDVVVEGPDVDGIYSASYLLVSVVDYNTCKRRLERSQAPSRNHPYVTFFLMSLVVCSVSHLLAASHIPNRFSCTRAQWLWSR